MTSSFYFKKVLDEGTASPFIARLLLGLWELRDTLLLMGLDDKELSDARKKFDRKFKPMYEAAQATRDGAREVLWLVNAHKINLASGKAVKIHDNSYEILETIDIPLGQAVDKLITQGIIAIKTGLQILLSDTFELNIGFMFQKSANFNRGIWEIRATGENDFAEYLIKVREIWLSDLLELRNKHEHHGWTLGDIQYNLISGSSIVIALPKVLNLPVDQFARYTANRIILFIENSMVYAFQNKSKRLPINIVETYPEAREPTNPQRFRLTPRGLDPSPPWKINYQDSLDFI